MFHPTRAQTSIAGLALTVLLVPIWWSVRGAVMTPTANHTAVPPDFSTILMRSRLDPEALAAAGLTASEVSEALQLAADVLNANPGAIANADSAFMSARTEVDRLQAIVQSGLATTEELAAYQTASSSLATAIAQRQGALDQVFNGSTSNLPTSKRSVLAQMRANSSLDYARELPLEFLVVDRTQAEWVSVRNALANERLAAKYPDLLSEAAQTSLFTWRANSTVAMAKNYLDSNLTAITTAWNTATGGT
jgi:hypothetical protein